MKTKNLLEQDSSFAPLEQKDAGLPTDPAVAIKQIAEAVEAFKASHAEEMAELKKKGAADPVLLERLSKIDTQLNAATEAKAALEASIAAERKEREELELRLQRHDIKGDGDAAKAALELKEFNLAAAAIAADRKRNFTPLDQKAFDEYQAVAVKHKRYVQAVRTSLTANIAYGSVIALLTPRRRPVVDHSTVADIARVSD